MTTQEIIDEFLPKLKIEYQLEYLKLTKNYLWKFIKNPKNTEAVFQFFVVRLLRQNGYTVVVNEKSGNKSNFEQLLYKVVGNKSGVSDIFVQSKNPNIKGYYLELKKSKSEIYKKDGSIRKLSSTKLNQKIFIEICIENGYFATFLYPENIKNVFFEYFKIKI